MTDALAQALDLIQRSDHVRALALLKSIAPVPEERAAEIVFYKGWCLELLGSENGAEAVACYQQAAMLRGNVETQVNSWFRAGWVEQSRREFAAAERSFGQAAACADAHRLRNSTYHHARFWQAVCRENIGRYLDARAQYTEVADEASDLRMECRYREIMCSIAVGDFAAALASCEGVGALDPDELSPRENELKVLVAKEEALLRRILAAS